MLLPRHGKDRKEGPKVVVAIPRLVRVIPESVKQRPAGLADVVWRIVAIEHVDARVTERLANVLGKFPGGFDVKDVTGPHASVHIDDGASACWHRAYRPVS